MNDASSRPRPAAAGFTAIELIVVIGIIIMLAGMALPGLVGSLRKGRVSDAANSIMTAASMASNLARSRIYGTTYYGVVVVMGNPASYAAVTFGATADTTTILMDGANPVCKLPFNPNVVVYDAGTGAAGGTLAGHNAATPMAAQRGWCYQFRTGFPFWDVTAPKIPADVEGLSVRTLDGQFRIALAFYSLGVANAQEF